MTSGASINYVIAAYLGDRRNPDPRYDADRAFFLREHIASLSRLKHSLSQITIVCSGGDPTGFCESLLSPTTIGTARVKVIMRPNTGMSYGAWSDAFEAYRSDFSHYILTEDDYLFTHDDFDALLLERMKRVGPECGMYGGTVYKIHTEKLPHMAVCIGMCPSVVLEKARNNQYSNVARLPYDDESSSVAAGFFGQTRMSYAIIDAGYKLHDWLDTWSSAFWDSVPQRVAWFGRGPNGNEDPLLAVGDLMRRSFIAPIQAIGKKVLVWDRGERLLRGSVGYDGSFVESAGDS